MNNPPQKPDPSEHAQFYSQYLNLVQETNVFGALEDQIGALRDLLGSVSEPDASCLHKPYTWTIKQVIGHCLDNERVFGYRACRFASGDSTDLPGYDQDAFVANQDYETCTLAELVDEFEYLRRANLAMIKRWTPDLFDLSGTGDGKKISVRAITFLLVGHLRHHLQIIEKRLGGCG